GGRMLRRRGHLQPPAPPRLEAHPRRQAGRDRGGRGRPRRRRQSRLPAPAADGAPPPALDRARGAPGRTARRRPSPPRSDMTTQYVHTCLRVLDPEASTRFYGALGFEPRGRLNFSSAYNLYLRLPGDGDVLELTVNRDQEEPYDLGTGYNHMAITVDDID